MANKRNLKKDIDYLIFEVVSDSYTYKYLFPDRDHKEVDRIIDEAFALQAELIMRVNHPDGKDNKKLVKKHYKKINQDLLSKVDDFFTRLNSLLAEGQKKTSEEISE